MARKYRPPPPFHGMPASSAVGRAHSVRTKTTAPFSMRPLAVASVVETHERGEHQRAGRGHESDSGPYQRSGGDRPAARPAP